MINLKKEIEEFTSLADIDYVMIRQPHYDGDLQEIDKDWFIANIGSIEYNHSYGGEVINTTLIIVLKDSSWLERQEYDGSEWFEHKKKPERPKK
jgi:hypothetical protein